MANESAITVVKVILGILLLLAGVPMLVLPGPGLVFILAGAYLIATVVPGGKEYMEEKRQHFNRWRMERRERNRQK